MATRNNKQQVKRICFDKENARKPNDKVRVQYIEHTQIMDQAAQIPLSHSDEAADEVENVEYLDESITEEYTQVMDGVAHRAGIGDKEDTNKIEEEFKDTFYSNAIHCLITLYRAKYEEMCEKGVQEMNRVHVWDEISKDMNESYFDFSSEQVRQKFKQLRQQYFNVCNVDAMIEFEYFIHLHEIYKDKVIDSIETGACVNVAMVQLQRVYPDDYLFQDRSIACNADTALISFQSGDAAAHEIEVETQQDEISHKENEFIDMVEKELQAMEEGKINAAVHMQQIHNSHDLQNAGNEGKIVHGQPVEICPVKTVIIKRELDMADAMPQQLPSKRIKSEITSPMNNGITATGSGVAEQQTRPTTPVKDEANQNQQDMNGIQKPSNNTTTASTALPGKCKEMSLADYNAAQQQRHQEKMELMRHSLKLQERTIEMQQLLMEQLIKRL